MTNQKDDTPFYVKRIVYQVPGMQDVQPHSHLVLKRPDGSRLTLDQYMPPGATASARLPAVLLVHGGPVPAEMQPMPKDWGVYVSYGQLIAASGLVGLVFNHRYFEGQGIQQSGEDIEAVMGYIQSNSDGLGVDPTRLCVWGFSGGGRLMPVILRKLGAAKCLALYYTLLDIKGHEKQWDRALARLPMFVAKAGLDHPRLNERLDLLASRAAALNAPFELVVHPAGQHGFDVLDDDETSREIIARTLKFIKANT